MMSDQNRIKELKSELFNAPLSCFITGTDTEIGKTLVASAIVHLQAQKGYKVAGMKPVAAGAYLKEGVWCNEDVDSLMSASSVKLDQKLICPYLFMSPVAPHIASQEEGRLIEPNQIVKSFREIKQQTEAVVVEGVGGFRVPLTKEFDTADLALELDLPVIMVVGLRLGCISHALLTTEAIAARGLKLIGWVANCVSPSMQKTEDNLIALKERIQAPLIARIPYIENAKYTQAAGYF
jgi:dethiobiotin synthetase